MTTAPALPNDDEQPADYDDPPGHYYEDPLDGGMNFYRNESDWLQRNFPRDRW